MHMHTEINHRHWRQLTTDTSNDSAPMPVQYLITSDTSHDVYENSSTLHSTSCSGGIDEESAAVAVCGLDLTYTAHSHSHSLDQASQPSRARAD